VRGSRERGGRERVGESEQERDIAGEIESGRDERGRGRGGEREREKKGQFLKAFSELSRFLLSSFPSNCFLL
jgi:hypothetical protein